ncbi:MAG: hypothetical protein JEZ10_08505 [Verrucomicrobia bacterium]|nr:hypothetical protein [Verrucomicrobiota bacterium]
MSRFFLLLAVLSSCAAIGMAEPAAFTQVVFQDDFETYEAGAPLPKGNGWSQVSANAAAERFATIREDEGNVFRAGKKNRYFQLRDNSSSGMVRVLAKNIPGLNSELLRLSMDLVTPDDKLEGSLSLKLGVGEASAKEEGVVVGGFRVEPSGKMRPAGSKAYSSGKLCHVDAYFNETAEKITYIGPDGKPETLDSGLMDFWIDGDLAADDKAQDRTVGELTAIKSLRIETFSSSLQEVWFDNIVIAVPAGQEVNIPKKVTLFTSIPAVYPDVVLSAAEIDAEHQLAKERYIKFLIGTEQTFSGKYGKEAFAGFMERIQRPIERAMAFDFKQDANKTFHIYQNKPGYEEEFSVYSSILQQYLMALAFGYTVNAPENPYYKNPEVMECYIQCLEYLYGRGVRDGMTFHYNENRMNMDGAPHPENGAGNIVKMELRMGAYCQSVLLMEPYFKETPTFKKARDLVRHLEMLGKTSGHVRYYDPYVSPPAFKYLVQSDAIQIYTDVTFVSALLEEDTARKAELLLDAKRVFSDSLKVIPGWADTIKPDFTGFHHRAIYGNAYTGGFIPQASFGVYVLNGTHYAVEPESVENLNNLILTYRLYCQKYSMPFGIRGRFPMMSDKLKTEVFSSLLIGASALGLNDEKMKPVYERVWDPEQVGIEFVFAGGRGKLFRGLYTLNMLEELMKENITPEPDPAGFWYKPYGGLAIHRRDNWMAAVKGYSKYIWDYENGSPDENVYGQYFSHGSLTIFSQGDPVSDIDSGYNLDEGWDWYRMPGTTAVHFPVKSQKPLDHRQFSPETFLGGVSLDDQNGLFGMILNQQEFGNGTRINLRAKKSIFFVDDFILMLGSGISGGDGKHAVETTLFQSWLPEGSTFEFSDTALADPAGNRYYLPETGSLSQFKGTQDSYRDDGEVPSKGDYAVAWFDHGLKPKDAGYEAGIGVRGAAKKNYQVICKDSQRHQVCFPDDQLTGYAFFQPLEIDDPIIGNVSDHCLVMVKQAENALEISVVNPDLGLLPRDSEIPTFKLIADGENQYLPSQPRPVEITLNGQWALSAPAENVTVIAQKLNKTVLRFDCVNGMDVRAGLIRK